MEKKYIFSSPILTVICVFLFGICIANAQTIQVEVLGGAVVTQGSTVTINAGNAIDFRITNTSAGCTKLKVQDVDISNTTDFDISPNNPKRTVRSQGCKNWKKYLDFEIENISPNCTTTSTLVTIEIKNQADFTFTVEVNSAPEIYVLGGSPFADIMHGDTTTSDTNGTYFGIIDEGNVEVRRYAIANIGSCDLDISTITSSNSDFAVSSPYPIPFNGLDPFFFIVFDVTFTAPVAGTGTQSSTISIGNSDNTTFTFVVEAEMFNENIPGPGGITADFRLWLKSTRGIVDTASKVSEWQDLGTNGKDAIQPTGTNQPTYLDTATDNINFNPVIKFENDGGATEQYLYNATNGFYSQDIFIVMIPDATMTSASARNTIFAGTSSGNAGDITGVGFGDYSSEFTNETLSYNQDVAGGGSYNGEAEISSSYANAGIINVRNNSATSPTGQDILYNSVVLTTNSVNDIAFANVGSPGPPILGTEYWIGRNFDVQGSLNGRIAEIFTFAERVTDADRQKIESYLAIKYGLTLGAATEAQKDYINSFDTKVWDITANAGYNYHVAGIGRDSISDLNQKQSKTLNMLNEVTIGLNGISTTNSANIHEFENDGDFLVWGSNDLAYTASGSNTITISSGITTSLTRVLRQWKIIESTEVTSDVGNVFVSIPSGAFSGFALGTDEEYVLVVADTGTFANADIIDVIPLKDDGSGNLQTWYDFDGTKYFTFGKAGKYSNDRALSIGAGDYLVGEYDLNLSVDDFTISAWIKNSTTSGTRTIMAKGEKLQLRLNGNEEIEVMMDDAVTPRFTSNVQINDGKWHQITFVYHSGTIFLYVDGVLDKSEQNVVHPSPNYNHFSVGAVYVDKSNILNPFLGEIDEIYVWDVGLTEDQIRYLMNQEVERFDISGTDYVDGKIIPQASTSNEIGTITWSHLRAYYDFNAFYGSTTEGLTDDRYFLRLKYLDKDKSMTDAQTIPVPYISANDGAWDTATTWSNNADQVIPNTTSLDGSTVVDWNIVEIGHNITSGDRDVSVLGLTQTAGKLTIADPIEAQDETNSGQALTVTHYLEIDGVIDLVGESQLIQTDKSIIDADSGGYIERDQQGTANGFNYNYWSSSVGPITGNTATRGTGISASNANNNMVGFLNDGTISGLYQDLTYSSSATASDGTPPPPGFARTISSHWLYKFYGEADNYFAWQKIDENTALLPGEGFTMKGTSGTVAIATPQNYVFEGLPYNGDITLELDNSSGEVDRLIGNPYPSAIDATEFILDNLSIADGGTNTNGTIFNGALYFWDHFGEENTHVLKEYVGGYATRNLTGGAAAISNDARINNTSNGGGAATGTKVPGEYIPVNQGFFVSTALDGLDNDNGTPILTVDGGDIVFKNSQRIFAREDGSTSLFTKPGTKKGSKQIAGTGVEKPMIKLIYSSPQGYHRQLVLGADPNASLDFDLGYDAFMLDVGIEDMYWLINDSRFVIQGVDGFEQTQKYDLGVKVKEAGIAKMSLELKENSDVAVQIEDTETGEVFNIENEPFEVYLEAGTYNDRFKLVFAGQSQLSVEEVQSVKDKLETYFDREASVLKVNLISKAEALSASFSNIMGQQILEQNVSSNSFKMPINVNSGVYILNLKTTQGTLSKKLILE
ncbi:T9SS type A sorting domain-containing protein [Hyunsoonleella sp. SJ7]|uniref:T9SS type A sorting domain-containing protein n=1 Tax=Hyunsoonleella aquatilis TaxID=2762758 RepID=A0A923H9V8_9FLAO|nr:LamG-like jellyroll fold domain-containing protein [Hyunsoonleella aquatilis]MBC3757031.1 T9SS type A sorting domain-containing protein [Hyunsoonleella aquatilis]